MINRLLIGLHLYQTTKTFNTNNQIYSSKYLICYCSTSKITSDDQYLGIIIHDDGKVIYTELVDANSTCSQFYTKLRKQILTYYEPK